MHKPRNRDITTYATDELHNCHLMIESREIFIHGYIDNMEDEPGVDWRMASSFLKNIRFLEHLNDNPIIIHQYSIGGQWWAGMMMYDAIIHCRCYVIFITHGLAASMGSIIPQAADMRLTMPNCDWLLHNGTTDIMDNFTFTQGQSWAINEQRHIDLMLNIYADKCQDGPVFQKKTLGQIKRYIANKFDKKEDWWLSAKEALQYGFVDAIIGEPGYETITEVRKFGYN